MAEGITDKRQKALLDAVREARAEFETLQDEVDGAKDSYHEAVRSLHQGGMPLREIAEHLGLSHQRVHQMLTERRGASKGKKIARGLGAAGVVVALVMSTIALLDDRQPSLPRSTSPPPTRTVRLVQEPVITRNDIAEVHRYEKPLASGRSGGKKWRYLLSYLSGVYCLRFEWTPGPRRQGEICSQIPKRTHGAIQAKGDLSYSVDPVMRNDQINPVPVAYGHLLSADITEVTLVTCDGQAVEARVFHEKMLPLSFFMAFLPEGTIGVSVRATDYRGEQVVVARSKGCD